MVKLCVLTYQSRKVIVPFIPSSANSVLIDTMPGQHIGFKSFARGWMIRKNAMTTAWAALSTIRVILEYSKTAQSLPFT